MQFIKQPWSQRAASILQPALDGNSDTIKAEVENGQAELWEIDKDSFMITRLETYQGRRSQLVLVAGAGQNADGVLAVYCDVAKKHNLIIRVHTIKPYMPRIFRRNGFTFSHAENDGTKIFYYNR